MKQNKEELLNEASQQLTSLQSNVEMLAQTADDTNEQSLRSLQKIINGMRFVNSLVNSEAKSLSTSTN